MSAEHPIASEIITVTAAQPSMIEPGQRVILNAMPRPQWRWRHPIRSWNAWWRWWRNPYRDGIDAVVVSMGGGSTYVVVHGDGCCCIDCRNRVM